MSAYCAPCSPVCLMRLRARCPNAIPTGGSNRPVGIDASANVLVRGFAGSDLMESGSANFTSQRTPSASTLEPRMARAAGSTVIDRIAASITDAMIA